MVSVTRKDINEDISIVSDSLINDTLPLVSPISALRMSMFFPLFHILIYTLAIFWRWIFFVPKEDSFGDKLTFASSMGVDIGFAIFGFIFACIIGANLYSSALMYLSIPNEVRKKSVVIGKLRILVKRLMTIGMLINLTLAIIGATWIHEVIAASPFIFLLIFFVMQAVVSAEMARFGMAPVLKKLTKLIKKI